MFTLSFCLFARISLHWHSRVSDGFVKSNVVLGGENINLLRNIWTLWFFILTTQSRYRDETRRKLNGTVSFVSRVDF